MFYLPLFLVILSYSAFSYPYFYNVSKMQTIPNQIRTTLLDIDLELALCGNVNLREITITQLQFAMSNFQLTSVQLVKCYTKRIQAMDPYLHSVLQINPDAIKIARKLDLQRSVGYYRGPMHGIPILIKDNIATDDSMETSAGSVALLGIKPKRDAVVVQLLRKAGAVILGKANMGELANGRTNTGPAGWSGRGGNTRNAYVLSKKSGGSSSGSAVAVAANLVAVALGTETCGSIIGPGSAASLVGLKPTLGRVSTEGTIPFVPFQDVVGPLTRSLSDAAIVFSIISSKGLNRRCFNDSGVRNKCLNKVYKVGVLRDPFWSVTKGDVKAEQLSKLNQVLKILPNTGITVIDPVVSESTETEKVIPSESYNLVSSHAFKSALNEYLLTKVKNNVVVTLDGVKVIRKMADIVKYNDKHPEEYDQQRLISAQITNGIYNRTYIQTKMNNFEKTKKYLNFIFDKYSLDAIAIPNCSDPFCVALSIRIPAVAGYPYITIPAGLDSKNLPFGISFIGKPNSEEILLILGQKLETNLKARESSRFFP